jgi:hypothetical protein
MSRLHIYGHPALARLPQLVDGDGAMHEAALALFRCRRATARAGDWRQFTAASDSNGRR